jgi:hypothetical protein
VLVAKRLAYQVDSPSPTQIKFSQRQRRLGSRNPFWLFITTSWSLASWPFTVLVRLCVIAMTVALALLFPHSGVVEWLLERCVAPLVPSFLSNVLSNTEYQDNQHLQIDDAIWTLPLSFLTDGWEVIRNVPYVCYLARHYPNVQWIPREDNRLFATR